MRHMLLVLLGLVALLVAACGEGGGGSPELDSPASAPSLSDGGARESAPPDTAAENRKEIVTGYLELTAGDPVAVGRQVVTIVENADGRVDAVTERPEMSSVLTVRVPADRLDGVIGEVRSLGRVTSLTTSRDDVTMQYTDLEARVGALRTSVDRLRALLGSATDTADLIEVERALAERQGELDSIEAQRRQLADMIDLSTLTLDISTERRPSDRDSFWDGLVSGWNGLRAALGAAVVALGVALPWGAFLVVCAGVVYLIVRLIARSGRSAGTSGEPPTERTDHNA
ncbi:DUF4349 domain-containing protein [Rhodococcus chondri]|uniref:DUF4349 domain-containing protein n=1 Tax=Rhodococcus chondri TaxID=3065941 RepID=A0ABU7JZL2_9NOCA|nr:DUF4349 domain-containing protein [Rhodococcus sp. CC-R104]MEE2035431.1 DUF4349 domain-containing protein [Rhodococcus sp. CC-R104]